MMQTVELIYLACPFRHVDLAIQRKRCMAAHYVAAQLSLQGHHVFSPLTHNEMLIKILNDAVPGEQWMQFDLAILAACKRLFVLKMEGWEASKGVAREIAFAKERGLLITEIEPPKDSEYTHLLLQATS